MGFIDTVCATRVHGPIEIDAYVPETLDMAGPFRVLLTIVLTLPMAVVVLVVAADRRVSRAVFKERASVEYPGPVPRFRA